MFANNPAHRFASSVASAVADAPSAREERATTELVDLLRKKFPRLKGSDEQLGKLVDSIKGLLADDKSVVSRAYPPARPDW